ncbi:MAG: phage holin family protein [Candidatus Paceibacterota bacterium]
MISRLIIQILTNAVAIYIAAETVQGFHLEKNSFTVLVTAGFIFGMINFFVKPFLKLLSAPIILLTLGLFTIFINVAMLLLLDYFVPAIRIDGFGAAFWAMLVISAVNFFIGFFSKK